MKVGDKNKLIISGTLLTLLLIAVFLTYDSKKEQYSYSLGEPRGSSEFSELGEPRCARRIQTGHGTVYENVHPTKDLKPRIIVV